MIHEASLTCDALGEVSVVRLRGVEAMNELSRFTVEVLSQDGSVDPGAVIATNASIAFADGAEMDSVAAGNAFRVQITRDANNAADTATGDAELVAVHIK